MASVPEKGKRFSRQSQPITPESPTDANQTVRELRGHASNESHVVTLTSYDRGYVNGGAPKRRTFDLDYYLHKGYTVDWSMDMAYHWVIFQPPKGRPIEYHFCDTDILFDGRPSFEELTRLAEEGYWHMDEGAYKLFGILEGFASTQSE